MDNTQVTKLQAIIRELKALADEIKRDDYSLISLLIACRTLEREISDYYYKIHKNRGY